MSQLELLYDMVPFCFPIAVLYTDNVKSTTYIRQPPNKPLTQNTLTSKPESLPSSPQS